MRIAEKISRLKDKLTEFSTGLSEAQKPVFMSFIFGLLANRFHGAVSGLSRHPLVNASEDQLNHFLSRGAVSELRLDEMIRRMIAVIKSKTRRKSAYLIIDDTLAEKRGEKIEGVGWYYDHAKKVYVWGQKAVLGILVVGGIRLPVEARLQLKEKDKVTMLFKRIFDSVSKYWTGRLTVLADAYYANYDLLRRIDAAGAKYIIQIRSNFAFDVDGKHWKVSEFVKGKRPRTKVKIGKNTYRVGDAFVFRKGKPYRLVYSRNKRGNWRFYLTNDGTSDAARVLLDYSVRWEIETFIKDVKGNLGFAKCHLRKEESILKFWRMIFLAYISLIWLKLTLRLNLAFSRLHEYIAHSIFILFATNHSLKLPMYTKPASENDIFYGI
jgi:hypothetical protein